MNLYTPRDEAEASTIVTEAAASGLRLAIGGANSKAALGRPDGGGRAAGIDGIERHHAL